MSYRSMTDSDDEPKLAKTSLQFSITMQMIPIWMIYECT